MQVPQPKRESLVAVLGVGVPCLVLCHFLVHGLGFRLLLLCLPLVGGRPSAEAAAIAEMRVTEDPEVCAEHSPREGS